MEVAESVDSRVYVEILFAILPLLGRQVSPDQAKALSDVALKLSSASDNMAQRCRALSSRARVHFVAGRWNQSFADLEEGIALALDAGHLGLAALMEIQLGSHLLPRGEAERAEQMYRCGLEHAREVGDVWLEGRGLTGVARAYVYADKREEAHTVLQRALDCARQVGDRQGECRTLGLMGRIESRVGRLAQAELHFRDALDCYRGGILPGRFTWILASRTEIYLRWGRLKAAERCARDALYMANARGTRAEVGVAQFNLGMLMLELAQAEQAETHIRQAKRIAESLGVRGFLGDVLMGMSWVHFERRE
jgi:tetratricopeptide (TPR) repeat protein